jgi:hypothetical protein
MRDLRRYARQTNARLLAGSFLLVFVVGLGLSYVFYGPGGALTGLACLLAAMLPVALIAGALWAMDRFVRRMNED